MPNGARVLQGAIGSVACIEVTVSERMKDILWIPVNALQALWMVGFTAFCFVPGMLTVLFTGNSEAAFSMGRAFWGPLNLRMGFSSLTIEGREHLPPAGAPFVAMFNHQSMIDIIVAWLVLPTGPRFVAKKQLLYVPVVGLFMLVMGMVPIDRSNRHAAIAALRKAQDVIKRGRILAVFPEGTRTRDGRVMPFKKGVFVVAQKANAPILPIALEGCATLVPRTGWHPRPSKLRVMVGAPIDARGMSRDALMRACHSAIIDQNVAIGGPGGDKGNPIAASEDDGKRVVGDTPAAAAA
jgi:1-acyl-sn-glycerol-3-phosphate acyltransferase